MNDDIDISGLKIWDVLAALYNSTNALGLGNLDPKSASKMTPDDAYKLLDLDRCEQMLESQFGLEFDYVQGRPIKVTMKTDGARTMLQMTRLFDRDSFRPAADVIAELRKSKEQ